MDMVINKSHQIPVVEKGDRFMTVTEVSNGLGMSSQAIYKAINEDRLDATEFVGKFYVLKSTAVKYGKESGRKFLERD